jgi:hypothetical protein
MAIDLQLHVFPQIRAAPFQNSRCTSAAPVYLRSMVASMRPRKIGSCDELRELLSDRADELNISRATLDGIAGVPDRYSQKLLSARPIRNFGPTSLAAILGALALKIVRVEIAEDPEAAARVSGRWVPRRRRPNPKRAVECVVPDRPAAQSSFTFEHEPEQGPDERQTHDDDNGARRRDVAGAG